MMKMLIIMFLFKRNVKSLATHLWRQSSLPKFKYVVWTRERIKR